MNLHLIALAVCIVGSFAGRTPLNINPNLSSRIVGGNNSTDGAHPFVVSLQYNENHKCAGTILSEKYIITAAHCVNGEQTNENKFKVRAGTNKLKGTADVIVEKITLHDSYREDTLNNDLAILKVTGMTLGPKISKISAETEAVGEINAILAGWGSTRAGGDFSDDLLETPVKTISEKACQDAYNNRTVTKEHICTATEAAKIGFCYGDSGSPLVREVEEQGVKVKKLVGIASWGTPCARGKPDVFIKVSSYVDWINKNCEDCLVITPPPPPPKS